MIALAVWLAAAAATAMWATIRPRLPTRGTVPPHALVLRPCAGAEPSLERALLSSAASPWPVRFALASADDAAHPTAVRVAAALRADGKDVEVVVTGATAPNRKAEQLARAASGSNADVLVVADSDVELDAGVLDALASALANADAAWAPPVEVAPLTPGDRASAALLDSSMHAFALLSALDAGGLVGKLFAVRTASLAEVGGFDGLSRHLGEDMELARRLRARGGRIAVVPRVARSLAQGRSRAAVVDRYARWLGVIRAQRPALLLTYPLLLAPAPLLLALGLRWPWLALLAVVYRLAVAAAARWRSGFARTTSLVADAVRADALLWHAFLRAATSSTVTWRGTRLRLLRGGEIGHDVSV